MIRQLNLSKDRSINWAFAGWWVLASTAGGLVGWFVSMVVALSTFGAGFLFLGGVVGLFLGIGQRWVLRRFSSTTCGDRWLKATVMGGGLSVVGFAAAVFLFGLLFYRFLDLNLISPDVLTYSLAFFVGVAVLSTSQWQALQSCLPEARLWLPFSQVGWSLGGYIGWITANTLVPRIPSPDGALPIEGLLALFITGMLATVIWAITTGVLLAWLLDSRSEGHTVLDTQ
jgi:hypothetical protein